MAKKEPKYTTEGCFGCGTENPFSLKLVPRQEGEKIVVDFTLRPEFRGFSKVAHGGIVCVVLDELMGGAASTLLSKKLATTDMQVTYRRPLLVGMPARGESWVVEHEGRDVKTAAHVLDETGNVLAEARANFRLISDRSAERFVGRR